MKKYKKTKILLEITFILIATIIIIRIVNEYRYPKIVNNKDVKIQDKSTYPKDYEGVGIYEINEGSLHGFHIMPDNKESNGVVVTFGGNEGGSNFFQGIEIAQNGYEVVSLFYFGQENQPETLNNVPLEFFGEFLEYADKNNIDTSVITLIGGSKGAELSLVLSNYYDEIDNMVLFSPSTYVFQGSEFEENKSSWTWNDEELPFISLYNSSFEPVMDMVSAVILNYPISYCQIYETAIENTENPDESKIDISEFDGDILVFSGSDDAMWDSATMTEELYDMNKDNVKFYIYENVGHVFDAVTHAYGIEFGGEKDNNLKAKEDSDSKLYSFLRRHHGNYD